MLRRVWRWANDHAAVVAFVVQDLFIFFAVTLAFSGVHGNHDALAAVKESGADARLGSCLQQQKSADDAIRTSHEDFVILSDKLYPPPRSPQLEANIQSGLAELHASDVANNPKRDCSPRGIADFLSGHGGYLPTPKGP